MEVKGGGGAVSTLLAESINSFLYLTLLFEKTNILLPAKARLHSMSPRRIKEASPVIVMERSRMPRRPHLSTVAQSNSQAPPPAHTDSRYVQ